MIRLDGVTRLYPDGHEALRGITLDIQEGEWIWVRGRSGAGKSTLLKLMAGIERPDQGTLTINRQEISGLGASALARLRRNIGLVFQDHRLLFDRSVGENVALPLRVAGLFGSEVSRRVRIALEKVGLHEQAGANPVALSGGEQQRLCIARAIVNRPSLLVVDEPTANLDPVYAQAILDILGSFHRSGVTVIMAMHDTTQPSVPGARTILLEDGTLGGDSETGSMEFA